MHYSPIPAPNPTSTTILMTTPTDKKAKTLPRKKHLLNHHVQSGERGRGDKERVLRVKPKDFTRR